VTARLASLSTRAQVAIIAAALLLVALIGYFAVIAPKRSTASDLKQQTAAVQAQIAQNRSTGFTQALPAVRAASVFNVTKAMPTQLETPEVILQLNQLAEDSGISFDQIQPGPTDAATTTTTTTPDPFAVEPIQVAFSGSFYDLVTFLQRVRNLVRVQNGSLFTAGRLFDVSNVSFQEGQKGWPQVQATLTINEFVPQTVSSAPTAAPVTTDTTSTTTTDTTTTSNPTSAAPSTSGGS
jgi:Tfp pilus assembly protein PilO